MRKLLLTLGLIALFAGTLHAQSGMGGTTGVIGNVTIWANNTTSCANVYAEGPNRPY